MSHPEQQHLDLLRRILETGIVRGDRTGTGTKSIFGAQLRFDLRQGFPLLTTKRVFFRGIVGELIWFLSGDTNIRALTEQDIHIWDAWADEEGNLGPVYGAQWRAWPAHDGRSIDQISQVIEQIRTRPYSRRHIVSAWNPAVVPDERVSPQDNARAGRAALASCHTLFQFYVAEGRLSCLMLQRSCDLPVGGAFNLAQYSLLTHMIAQQCDLDVGDFIWTLGDVHIYLNQIDGVEEQLGREPRPFPTLKIRERPASIFEYRPEDFELVGYAPHPHIKMPVAV
jgi:thymidylate synthase